MFSALFDSDLRRSISAVLSENRAVVKAAIIFSITKILTYQRVVLAGRRRNSDKKCVSTTLGIPRRSPIQVLTEPDAA